MGDSEQPPTNTECDVPKPSIDILKEAKPSADISISPNHPSLVDLETTVKSSDTVVPEPEKVVEDVEEAPLPAEADEAKDHARNRSDIFSLNENKNLSSTIFSVGGAPSKTIHRSMSVGSNKTEPSVDDTVASTGSQQSQLRNPLTGYGVTSNDEFKNKPTKRRDGNPLLGVGYKDDRVPQGTRIPPGGYSKGLW